MRHLGMKSPYLLQEVLLSDSSESSNDEDDPVTEEDFKQMLRVHNEQKLCRKRFLNDRNVRIKKKHST